MRSRPFILALFALLPGLPLLADPQLMRLRLTPVESARPAGNGVLLRELARQAFLMCAREEFGLATRDQALREWDGNAADAYELRIKVDLLKEVTVALHRGGDEKAIWSGALPLPKADAEFADDYIALHEWAATCEQLSRKQFVEALTAAGFKQGDAFKPKRGEVPETMESRLNQLNFVAQVDALRRLHGLSREQGNTRAILAAKSRAHANLGALTELHWNNSAKVFKARALLYAGRLNALYPDSAYVLWSRAYARALAGLYGAALADLAEASKIQDVVKDGGSAPAWLGVIESHCRYDVKALNEAAAKNAELAPLATFLALLNVAGRTQSAESIEKGKPALDANRENFYVIDRMCIDAGVGLKHSLTPLGPEVLVQRTLRQALAGSADLPATVRAKINAIGEAAENVTAAQVADVWKTLLAEGDAAKDAVEPSWAALARLIEDTHFLHTWRRAAFIRDSLGLDINASVKFIDDNIALVGEDHPFHAFLRSFAISLRTEQGSADRLAGEAKIDDPAWTMHQYIAHFGVRGREIQRQYADRVYQSRDSIARDFETGMRFTHQVMAAKVLLRIAPKSPFAAQAMVDKDWANQKASSAEYEKWGPGIASHLGLIGIKHLEDGQTEDAYRCFNAYLKLVKDEWVYRRMAGAHLKAGDIDGWLKYLEAYLRDSEDYGLSHARVRMEIARELMELNKYERAKAYALESAESGAEWAISTAAECHEGLGELDQAWQLLTIKAERYSGSPFSMVMFCWRTGKGDLEMAEKHAQNAIRRNAGPDRAGIAHYYFVKGDRKAALQWYKRALPGDPVSVGLQTAIAAEEAGDKLLRDEALNRLVVKARESAQPPDQLAIAKLLQQTLARGEKELPDAAAVDRLIASESVAGKLTIREVIGRFLLMRGEKEKGIAHLKAVVASSQMGRYSYMLAWKALKDQGLDPAKAREEALKK